MAYDIIAVIGRADLLQRERLCGGCAVPLSQGLVVVPLIDAMQELSAIYGNASPDDVRDGFGNPPPSIVPRVSQLSHDSPIAFVEAEYFGGRGDQAAVVWQDGRAVFGPIRGGGAINQALRLLGVVSEPDQDEFDSVALGRHRMTERWLRKEEPA